MTCFGDKIRQGDRRSNDNFSLITSQIFHYFQIGFSSRPNQRSIWKSTETKCDISTYKFTLDTFLCYSWYLFRHKEIPKLGVFSGYIVLRYVGLNPWMKLIKFLANTVCCIQLIYKLCVINPIINVFSCEGDSSFILPLEMFSDSTCQ